mgnify:CR=1 FL=1
MVLLGCCPPALPHIQGSRDSEHFVFSAYRARRGWWEPAELRTVGGSIKGAIPPRPAGHVTLEIIFPACWAPASLSPGRVSCQLVAFCASWWIADLEFCTKNFLVTLPQIFCMGKHLWLCMANGPSHTNDPWPTGKNATFVFAVAILVKNRSVDI